MPYFYTVKLTNCVVILVNLFIDKLTKTNNTKIIIVKVIIVTKM